MTSDSSISGWTQNSYDANGSLVESQSNAGTNTYTFDLRNRMVGATVGGVTSIDVYDDAGNRVVEATGGTTNYYLTDSNNPSGYAQPIEQWTSTSGTRSSATLAMSYIIGDRVLAQETVAGTISYLLVDGLDNTRALATSAGTSVSATFIYDSSGDAINFTLASAPTTILFQQTMYDAASGLNVFGDGTRDAEPRQDSFIEQDTPGYSNNQDPLTLNLTLLDGADQTNMHDPSGHDGIVDLLFTLGIALTVTDALYHVSSAVGHFANGQNNAGEQDMVWAMIDVLTLGIPIGPAAGPAAEAATSAIALSRTGVPAASIWGYLTTLMSVANNGGGGGSTSSSGGSAGGSSNSDGPGQWVAENQSGWSDSARAYQAQISGRVGQQYVVDDVSFDGWNGTNLLEAKDFYSWALDDNGNWANWFQATGGVQKFIKQAQAQFLVAGGRPIEWHCSEQSVAKALQPIVGQWVKVIYTP